MKNFLGNNLKSIKMKKVVKKNLLKGIMLMFIAIIPFVCESQIKKITNDWKGLLRSHWENDELTKAQIVYENIHFSNGKVKKEEYQDAFFTTVNANGGIGKISNNIIITTFKGIYNILEVIFSYGTAIEGNLAIMFKVYDHNLKESKNIVMLFRYNDHDDRYEIKIDEGDWLW
jgi:mRNA-degrading endonuclease YafQ of YafQ-DinJ toxin-antitoxin module